MVGFLNIAVHDYPVLKINNLELILYKKIIILQLQQYIDMVKLQ